MGGKSAPATTTQISKTELPAWVERSSEDNYNFAKQIADKPYEANPNLTVVGTDPSTTQAYDFFNKNVGSTGNNISNAAGAIGGLLNYNGTKVASTDVTPQMLKSTDLTPYLNPYTNEVENKAMDALDRSRTMSLMSNADKAVAAGAFGGSRSGVVDAVTNAETARAAGELSANLRKSNYDQAVAAATGDINRATEVGLSNRDSALKAALANQNNDLASAAQRESAAKTISDLASKTQQANNVDYAGLLDMGSRKQAQAQSEADMAAQKWAAEHNADLDKLNIRLASLGMSPYGKTETTNKTSTSEKKGTDWTSIALGGMSMIGSLFSDETEKTDKKKIGKDPKTGIDLYSYRYKGDPKSYPKVVGPMAQDVKKKFPGAVKKVGGKRGKLVVNTNVLNSIGGW